MRLNTVDEPEINFFFNTKICQLQEQIETDSFGLSIE